MGLGRASVHEAAVAIYTREDAPAAKTKAFVHIPEAGAHHYREAAHAMSQTKTRELVLRRAPDELIQWKKRYRDLEEFAQLLEVIDRCGMKFRRYLAADAHGLVRQARQGLSRYVAACYGPAGKHRKRCKDPMFL